MTVMRRVGCTCHVVTLMHVTRALAMHDKLAYKLNCDGKLISRVKMKLKKKLLKDDPTFEEMCKKS